MTMAYEHERWITHLIEHKLFIEGIDPKEETRAIDELKEVYAKAKSFNEIVPFVREQYVRANQNYGFAKYYGKSNEELKQAEEELFEKQQIAMTVCKVLGITLEEFIYWRTNK